jgi:bacillithiol biosynthesis deacetylase BshB1
LADTRRAKRSRTAAPDTTNLDVLAFGTHPDDLEIACGGTLISLVRRGYRVGAADLTRGELGTRGSAAIRDRETAAANKVLGLELRVNLGLPDGNIEATQTNLISVMRIIRQYRPMLLLAPYWEERHYDHVHASTLISEAAFYSGLAKIDTGQPAFRPFRVLYYLSRIAFVPSFVVDISETFNAKMEALQCYSSQFHSADAGSPRAKPKRRKEPGETLISTPLAWEVFETVSRYYGAMIGARHGEPFVVREALELNDPVAYFQNFPSSRQAHLFPGR